MSETRVIWYALPRTGDDVEFGLNATVWFDDLESPGKVTSGRVVMIAQKSEDRSRFTIETVNGEHMVAENCYSTRDAALAAAKELPHAR